MAENSSSGGSGVGLGSMIGGWISQFAQNVFNKNETDRANARDWANTMNERMYNRAQLEDQRLYDQKLWEQQNAYNEDMWNKMNAYNSPMAQMQRYKEAGLNPALIYGQSNTAPAIQTAQQNNAGQPSPTSFKGTHKFQADFGDVIQTSIANYLGFRSQSNALKMQEQQIREQSLKNDLLASTLPDQKDIIKYDAQGRYYDSFNKGEETNAKQNLSSRGNSYWYNDLDLSQKIRRSQLGLMTSELKWADETNEAKSGLLTEQWNEVKARVPNRAQRVELEKFENQMKLNGVYPGDGIYWRIASAVLEKLGYGNILKNIFSNATTK